MTNAEKKLIEELMSDTITKMEFRNRFPVDIQQNSDYILSNLEKAFNDKNADDIEDILFVGFSFSLFSNKFVNVLCDLIIEEWHYKHEDIAMILQELKDPQSIDNLYKTALSKYEYLDYDDSCALAVKCIWALGDINTDYAREKLKLLATSDNSIIKENAVRQLNRNH
nr:hypothetical protein [uncultured Desulfobacter sp.]